jgi:dihydroxyacetone kinase-like protein
MELQSSTLRSMIALGAQRIVMNSSELCALDLAIGDGDHGTNMKRGGEAVLAKLEAIVALPTGEALSAIGKTLVMTIGGASGPLYGSLFLAAGAAVQRGRRLPEDLVDVLAAGVEAVGARGRSTAGEKTMLDVLVPVLETIRVLGARAEAVQRVRATALQATQQTVALVATKGRAAYLGGRSLGHIDPGARSSCLLVEAVCDILEERP